MNDTHVKFCRSIVRLGPTAAAMLLVCAAGTTGCGGGTSAAQIPTSSAAPSTSTPVVAPTTEPEEPAPDEPAPLDEAGQKREALAARTLEVLRSSDLTPDDAGTLAAHALAEPDYGLPDSFRKGMEALASKSVDPSQRALIIATMMSEPPGDAALGRACGRPASEVLGEVVAGASTEDLLQVCGAKSAEALNGRAVTDVAAPALLLSLGTLEVLAERGGRTPSEAALARYLVQFPIPGRP